MIYSDYQMFSKAGNKACESLVKKVIRKIKSQQKMTYELILEMCKTGCIKIAEKYPEVYDSEPVYHISVCVNKALMLEGYNFKVDSYDFH